jgi:hypothetical protein
MDLIPNEIIIEILLYLDYKDILLNVSRVSKSLWKLCETPYIWRKKLEDLGGSSLLLPPPVDKSLTLNDKDKFRRFIEMILSGELLTKEYLEKNLLKNIWYTSKYSGCMHFMYVCMGSTAIISRPNTKEFVIKYLRIRILLTNCQEVSSIEDDMTCFFTQFPDAFLCVLVEIHLVNHTIELNKILKKRNYFDGRVQLFKGINYSSKFKTFQNYGCFRHSTNLHIGQLYKVLITKSIYFHQRFCDSEKIKEIVSDELFNSITASNYSIREKRSTIINALALAVWWSSLILDPDYPNSRHYNHVMYIKAFRS